MVEIRCDLQQINCKASKEMRAKERERLREEKVKKQKQNKT